MDPNQYDQFLIQEYLKYGSIDKVFKSHHYDLAISYAGFARLLDKYKIVKSAGPNTHLSESLFLLNDLATYKISLEKYYHRHAPKSVQVSTNTLHRILHCVRHKMVRRVGTALLISQNSDTSRILVATDNTLRNPKLGKAGDLSLPMTHSKAGENPRDSIVRVLQQEVFSNLASTEKFPFGIIPKNPKPLMYVNIADIRVSVYRLIIPSRYNQFFSYKLSDYHFHLPSEIINHESLRAGVRGIMRNYLNPSSKTVSEIDSDLNKNLLVWAQEMVK